MTVHWNKQCMPCKDVVCLVPVETHRRKEQPRLVLRGFAESVSVDGETITIK